MASEAERDAIEVLSEHIAAAELTRRKKRTWSALPIQIHSRKHGMYVSDNNLSPTTRGKASDIASQGEIADCLRLAGGTQ